MNPCLTCSNGTLTTATTGTQPVFVQLLATGSRHWPLSLSLIRVQGWSKMGVLSL